jgi:hypothetical protein
MLKWPSILREETLLAPDLLRAKEAHCVLTRSASDLFRSSCNREAGRLDTACPLQSITDVDRAASYLVGGRRTQVLFSLL